MNDTAGDYWGYQDIQVMALLPESYEDNSRVGIEAQFSVHLPTDAVAKGDWLMSWVTLPTYETVYDETTGDYTDSTTNYSLACIIQAGLEETFVMNFEGSGSMWYDANNPVSLMDTNKDDQVQMESADGTTTASRRMLKGKRKGGKK